MFFNTINYFKFLLKSQNQHGLHSPFVYDFVTKGLYNKKIKNIDLKEYSELKKISQKQKKILSKILIYFKINTVFFDLMRFRKSSNNDYKILFINNLNILKILTFSNLSTKHIILVSGIYQDKKSYNLWLNVIKNKDALVTIDLFYFGLIFLRKKQAKEHFIIRA